MQQITFCAATLALIKSWELGIDRTQGSALGMIRAGLRERDRVPAVMQHMLSQQLHFLSWILWSSVLSPAATVLFNLLYVLCKRRYDALGGVPGPEVYTCQHVNWRALRGGLLSACSVRVCERNVTKSANLT